MQIILLEDIRNLGKIGEVVDVKDGYGRNFLLKLGKALRADKNNIDFVNKKKDEINKKNIELKKSAKYFIENFKETIHPSQLDLKQEINKVGKFSLTINLHSDLVAELHVMVEKKDSK